MASSGFSSLVTPSPPAAVSPMASGMATCSRRIFPTTRSSTSVCAERDTQESTHLGPGFGSREVGAILDRKSNPYERIEELEPRCKRIAEALDQGKVVVHHSGRMDFGPRALGARSILPDRQGVTRESEDRSDGVPAILTIDEAEIEELLRAQWAKEPPRAELAPALLARARELVPEEEVEEDGDPYIYRMF
jgi:hypothetical protein